jgi:hypothetical protein
LDLNLVERVALIKEERTLKYRTLAIFLDEVCLFKWHCDIKTTVILCFFKSTEHFSICLAALIAICR